MTECFCGYCNGGIMAEILAVKPEEYIEPKKSSGTFESIGETMNDFEKKAFTVMERYKVVMKEKFNLIESEEIENKEKEIIKVEIMVLDDKRDMVRGLLYFSIQDRLNLWGVSRLGVSAGFKIIIPDEEANSERETTTIAIPIGMILQDILKGVLSSALKEKGESGLVEFLAKAGETGKKTLH